MPRPNLLHPVTVTFQQIDRSATVYDPHSREPIQAADRSDTWTIPGQFMFGQRGDRLGASANLKTLANGASSEADGYVMVRFYDLANHPDGPKTIQIGDRVTTDGFLESEFYIVRLQPRAHYTDQGGPSLLKCWFNNRAPAKER